MESFGYLVGDLRIANVNIITANAPPAGTEGRLRRANVSSCGVAAMSGGGLVGARIWSARRGSCVEIQDPITSS